MTLKHGWTPKPPPRINPPPPPNVSKSRGLVVSKEQADQLKTILIDTATLGWEANRDKSVGWLLPLADAQLVELFGVLGVSVEEQK